MPQEIVEIVAKVNSSTKPESRVKGPQSSKKATKEQWV
jgi:hypothetical protein